MCMRFSLSKALNIIIQIPEFLNSRDKGKHNIQHDEKRVIFFLKYSIVMSIIISSNQHIPIGIFYLFFIELITMILRTFTKKWGFARLLDINHFLKGSKKNVYFCKEEKEISRKRQNNLKKKKKRLSDRCFLWTFWCRV